MQTPIITQREIVRLLEQRQLSNRAIARQLAISHNTVAVIRSRLQVTGLSHCELVTQTDEIFARALGTTRKPSKTETLLPEWHELQTELQKRDITLALLWEEYRLANQNQLGAMPILFAICQTLSTVAKAATDQHAAVP